jgi:hypothetical protein
MAKIEFFDTARGLMASRFGNIAITNDGAQSWPNPASVQLQLSLPDFAHQGAALRITTTSGGLMHEQQVSGTQASISLDNWPSGVYLYTLSTPHNKVTGKFVVK